MTKPGKSADPRSADSPALHIHDLVHVFRRPRGGFYKAIDGLTFDVAPHEFVAVMGPSGSGKSTLLMVIAGFMPPTHGWVALGDSRVSRPGRDRGMVFQKPALYPWMTVRENVEFGPLACGLGQVVARERADRLLREVGLVGFEQYRPYELSGGMQHRAALARTLANEPRILLMDEPFAALDAQIRADMQALLLDVWQMHRSTVVFVTHDIEEGLLLADRAIILTKAPAKIRSIINVDIPRPRSYDTVLEPQFVAMRREVRSLLQHER